MIDDIHEYGVYANVVDVQSDEEDWRIQILKKIIMLMIILHVHIEI